MLTEFRKVEVHSKSVVSREDSLSQVVWEMVCIVRREEGIDGSREEEGTEGGKKWRVGEERRGERVKVREKRESNSKTF